MNEDDEHANFACGTLGGSASASDDLVDGKPAAFDDDSDELANADDVSGNLVDDDFFGERAATGDVLGVSAAADDALGNSVVVNNDSAGLAAADDTLATNNDDNSDGLAAFVNDLAATDGNSGVLAFADISTTDGSSDLVAVTITNDAAIGDSFRFRGFVVDVSFRDFNVFF